MEIIIKPRKGLSGLDFKELWQYRELFYFLSWKEVKLRYKQTIFGILWAVLQPFFTMVVFTVIFGNFAKIPSDNIPYPIFVYAGLLLWNIFSTALNNASQSLVNNANIIQKIYFPKIILLVSSIIVSLIDFLFAGLIFLGIIAYFGFLPHILGLIILPLSLIVTIFASLGLGLFLSAFNVKYRDVRYILPFFLQLLIFITPVIYPTSIVPQGYRWILSLNPMTGAIEVFRNSFLGTNSISWTTFAISALASIVFLIFGLLYFLKTEKNFADVI